MLLTRGRAGLPLPALSLALVLLLAVMPIEVTIAADLAAGGTSDDAAADIPCPYQYERHSLEQVTSGQRRPWLWDGIFHNFGPPAKGMRFCVNCHRGSLWPTWCGRRPTGQPYWDLQLCERTVTQLAMRAANDHDDIRGALTMTPCDLFRQIRGRTLWVIGDSMSKDLTKALKCFMLEFFDLHQYHLTNNYTAMHHLNAIPGYGEPNCIHLPGSTRVCQVHAIQGDLFVNTTRAAAGVLPLILSSRLAVKDDILVLNFGLWHGENQREQYAQHLHELGRWYAAHRAALPHVFFMETPKQHFTRSADGDFKTAWLTDRAVMRGNHTCGPIEGVSYERDGSLRATAPRGGSSGAAAAAVVAGTWRNADARAILRDRYAMRLVPIYNATVAFWDMHRRNFAGTECSHFCHPSVPQLWLWVLHKALKQAGIRGLMDPEFPDTKRNGCARVFERDQTRLGLPKTAEQVLAAAGRSASSSSSGSSSGSSSSGRSRSGGGGGARRRVAVRNELLRAGGAWQGIGGGGDDDGIGRHHRRD